MAFTGLSGIGYYDGTVAAQASSTCALLTTDEIGMIANSSVAEGVLSSIASIGSSSCLYSWGEGVRRFNLDVTVNDASRMVAGMASDAIKQWLQSSVIVGTDDEVIADVGEAAVFKVDSALYVHGTALVKGRVLQVRLHGFVAREKKDGVISLLKSAASRL